MGARRGGVHLLRALREIAAQRSPTAREFEILVHGAIPLKSPKRREAAGFYTTYHVAADTPEHALELIRERED
jgi:hypothetical protein